MKKFAVICLLLVAAAPAGAVEGNQVLYTGGTIPDMQAGVLGRLDTKSESALSFEYAGNKLTIPYARIESFKCYEEVARHLGVLPAIVVGLVKKRQRKHFFEISYRDESNRTQVAIFEVSKKTPPTLLATLLTRSSKACMPSNVTICNRDEGRTF
jgi:hypothetical protein